MEFEEGVCFFNIWIKFRFYYHDNTLTVIILLQCFDNLMQNINIKKVKQYI